MDILAIKNEYDWVVKVLESCVEYYHVEVSSRLFDQFIDKWSNELSEIGYLGYRNQFDILRGIQMDKILDSKIKLSLETVKSNHY